MAELRCEFLSPVPTTNSRMPRRGASFPRVLRSEAFIVVVMAVQYNIGIGGIKVIPRGWQHLQHAVSEPVMCPRQARQLKPRAATAVI